MENDYIRIYIINNEKDIYKVITKLKQKLINSKFVILSDYNIGEVIKKSYKSFDDIIYIIEFCNPTLSKMIINDDINNRHVIPCKITSYINNQDEVVLSFPNTLSHIEVESKIKNVLNKVDTTLNQLLKEFAAKN